MHLGAEHFAALGQTRRDGAAQVQTCPNNLAPAEIARIVGTHTSYSGAA